MMGKTAIVAIIALVAGVFLGSAWAKQGAGQEEKNKAVVERFVEEFKNKANFDVVDELYASDAKVHLPLPIPQTTAGLKLGGQGINAAFGDIKVTPEDIFAKGDKVVERSVVTAVHKGDFSGIPATNKQVNWTENHIYQLKEGKIVEQWSEINIAGILAQITPPKAE